jgi:hypothetical protein
MNNELRISILFSVIVKIYNFVVDKLKSGAERTRARRERKRTSEVTVQECEKNGVNNKDNEPATSTSAQPPPLASISDIVQFLPFCDDVII